jgi:ABC-2 type transport system permease protein
VTAAPGQSPGAGRAALWMALRAALRAEAVKLRTVRSVVIVPGVALVLGLGVGLLDVTSIDWTTVDRTTFDPVAESFAGFTFTELAFAALGVLAISTEYATRLIDTTFLALPRRGPVFAAKALLLAAYSWTICTVTAFAAFLIGQVVLAGHGADVGFGHPGVLRAMFGAGFYLTVVTLVGFAVGALLRHTAAAMAAMFGLVFLTWPVARALDSVSTLPSRMLLVNAGNALTSLHRPEGPAALRTPSVGGAALVMLLYLVVSLSAAGWRFTQDG